MDADDNLLDLADVVLDARPLDWAAVAERLPATQRPLLADLQAVGRIASFHLESSLAGSRTVSRIDDDTSSRLPNPGESWGPLTVLGPIGRGRYGHVYHAREPRLDRQVALKLLRGAAHPDTDASAVINEARLLARVRHPNVVTVFGAERIDGRVGLWMELVEGSTLETELQKRGPLTWTEVAQIGRDLADALGAAHRAGLLHRDVKAQNVLRASDGRVVLADFGGGAVIEPGDAPPEIAGTPLYLAPEIFVGGAASRASDVYSLGVLLFHLLTNAYPVRGRRLAELREAHAQGRRSSLAEARSDVPKMLAAIVDRALAASPEARWASAEDLRDALAHAAMDGAPVALVTDAPRDRQPWARWAWAGALTAAVTLLAAGVAIRSNASSPSGGAANAAVATVSDPSGGSRKIRLPAFDMGRPSRDGSVIPYVSEAGLLHLWEVATGRSHQLTPGTQPPAIGRTMVASPNGDRVAYPWSHGSAGFELHVIRADGTWPRVLLARQTAYEPVPVDWSPDGRDILCWLRQKNGSVDLVLVPAEGGQPRLLQTFTTNAPTHGRFSPDGRHIALARVEKPGARIGDVLVMDMDGSPPQHLVAGANVANAPTWTPDGRLVFLREAAGQPGVTDAWVLRLEDGAARGDPTRLVSNVGFAVIDVTTRGELYRNLQVVAADVYIAAFDLSGATPPGPPSRISTVEVGNHVGPSWSPDGRFIAYFTISERGIPGAVPERTLTLQDLASGGVRTLPLPLNFLTGYSPIWHPDASSLLVYGKDEIDDSRFGHYRVQVPAGSMTPFVVVGGRNLPSFGAFTRDGRSFFYSDPSRGLISHRVSDGVETLVVANGTRDAIGRVFVAPDGHAVAYSSSTRRGEEWVTAIEMVDERGVSRTLLQASTPTQLDLHGWAPDSRSVLYTTGEAAHPRAFWRQPVGGGIAVNLKFAMTMSPNPISLSPDGRLIAYVERVVERELWISPLGQ